MKLITAIIKADMLDEVTRAVTGTLAREMTGTDVHRFSCHVSVHRDSAAFLIRPELRVDVVVEDEIADLVACAITKSADTGTIGDGRIWISPVESALRVRTGERDHCAI
jgi:nitrogen regulatory protein P-II 1